jgi:multimeric flavodoxin WrbA
VSTDVTAAKTPPLIVGVGGTLRSNSSTECALRQCLSAVERQGGRTMLFCGDDIDLPMYNPHDETRTDKATALLAALRDADAVVVGSPGYHGGVSGLVKNALDYTRIFVVIPASTSTTLRGDVSAAPSDGRRRSERSGSCASSATLFGRGPHPSASPSTRPTRSGMTRANWSTSPFEVSWTCSPPS